MAGTMGQFILNPLLEMKVHVESRKLMSSVKLCGLVIREAKKIDVIL